MTINLDATIANADWPKRTPDRLKKRSAFKKYSEDQPRQANGRFGSGGISQEQRFTNWSKADRWMMEGNNANVANPVQAQKQANVDALAPLIADRFKAEDVQLMANAHPQDPNGLYRTEGSFETAWNRQLVNAMRDPSSPIGAASKGGDVASHPSDEVVAAWNGMSPADRQLFYAKVFVDANLDSWHQSASDSNPRSVALQQAALDEFNIKDGEMGWKTAHVTEDLKNTQLFDTSYHAPGAQQATQFDDKLATLYAAQPPELFRAFVRAQYDHTQAELAKVGFKPDDTVQLYRGVHFDEGKEPVELTRLPEPSGLDRSDIEAATRPVETTANPMSSWSTDVSTAENFAARGVGFVLDRDVPVKDILSTARSGAGALGESEFIVRGGVATANVRKV